MLFELHITPAIPPMGFYARLSTNITNTTRSDPVMLATHPHVIPFARLTGKWPMHMMLFDTITCMFYLTYWFFNVCLSTKYHYCNRFLPCFISNTHHNNLHGHLSVNTSHTVLSTHHTCCTLPIKFSCLSLNKCHKCFAFDTLHSQHTS